jgi:hypothetical protein
MLQAPNPLQAVLKVKKPRSKKTIWKMRKLERRKGNKPSSKRSKQRHV